MGLKILSGDFKSLHMLTANKHGVYVPCRWGFIFTSYEYVPVESLEVLNRVETEGFNSAPVSGCCLGLALNLFLGPIGLLLGLLAQRAPAPKTQEITFRCVLRDGRHFVAVADPATYQTFVVALHGKKSKPS